MITEKIFKNIILTLLALVALIVTLFAIAIADESANPVDEDFSLTLIDIISLTIALGKLVSVFMLYKFKPIGKKLFVLTFVLGFVISLFEVLDYSSYTPVISALEGLLYVFDGIILATLYFTSIKEKFD